MIDFTPDWITLSSSLPRTLTITDAEPVLTFNIYAGDDLVYATTLYALSGLATFYGLRTIVEAYMLAHELAAARLTLSAESEAGDTALSPFLVQYAAVRPNVEHDADFIATHFLTTRTHYILPRTARLALRFTASDLEQNYTPRLDLVFRTPDGLIHTLRHTPPFREQQTTATYIVDVVPAQLAQLAEGTLLAATVVAGARVMPVYITDRQPTLSFAFLNAFNLWEFVHVYGTTTLKTALERKEATCDGVLSFYASRADRTYEVQTAALTPDEAHFLNEFLTAPRATLFVSTDQEADILIADATSELSDSPTEAITLKFTYRYADPVRHLRLPEDTPHPFSPPFDPRYE